MAETAERIEKTMEQVSELGLNNLKNSLLELIHTYSGYPWPEDSDSVETELETAVNDLLVINKTSTVPEKTLILRLRIKISGFDVWRLRAYRKTSTGQRDYWNPLDRSYAEFEGGSGDVRIALADAEFPPRDIVRNWCNEYLKN